MFSSSEQRLGGHFSYHTILVADIMALQYHSLETRNFGIQGDISVAMVTICSVKENPK